MPDSTGGRTGDNEAHEHVELSGQAIRLENALEHHAYPTIATWVEKHNRYAIWEAAECDRFLRDPIPHSIGSVQRFKRRLKKIAWRLPMRRSSASSTPISCGLASSTENQALSSVGFWPFTTSWHPPIVTNNRLPGNTPELFSRSRTPPESLAPKGHNNLAQDNALGSRHNALGSRHNALGS